MATLNSKFHRQNFEHLASEPMIKFKDEGIHGHNVTICSYMIASPELWNQSMAEECRGIVWDNAGNCICLPFEKFFNVGERETTQPHNLPWADGFSVFEKRDGSMVTPVLLSDGVSKNIVFKTKKSFFSEVALEAQVVAKNHVEIMHMCQTLLEMYFTPIFEFTSPNNEVVIDYGNEAKFVLLAIRDQFSGKYLPHYKVQQWADAYHVDAIKKFENKSYDELKNEMTTLENFEGYVILFNNGLRVKMKTDWYLRMHRCKTELRERDVAQMVVDENIDDIKSAVSAAGLSLAPIEAIEQRVASQLAEIVNSAYVLYTMISVESTRKEAAAKYHSNEYFGLAMKILDGKEPNYVNFWKRAYLDQYSLKTIYSNFKE